LEGMGEKANRDSGREGMEGNRGGGGGQPGPYRSKARMGG